MRKLLLFFFLVTLTSCNPAIPGVVTVTPSFPHNRTATPTLPTPLSSPNAILPTATVLPDLPTVEPAPTASPSPVAVISETLPTYTIDALMDYDARTLEIQQAITYPNTSGETLNDIVLAVEPNRVVDVFSLQSVSADGTPVSDYSLEAHKLTLKLPTPLTNGQTVNLAFTYQLTLPTVVQGDPNLVRPKIFGVSTRQINLTDWYPMVVPYIPGQGWVLHDPWFYGEHLVYPLADFDVTIRFTDPISAPVIASSGVAETPNSTHYVLKNARTFALALGRQMQVVSAEVDGVKISSYYYPGAETPGQAALDATVKALQTYTELFGTYPHQSLAVVQGDFNDGMEFDGLYYLSNAFYTLYDGTEKNYLVLVAVHETCHQWWFGRVANDQALHPWLDESLSTYCERLFYEKNYPDSVAWWWSYRVDFYTPEGQIDHDVPFYGGFNPYTNATYRLGARFLEELRTRLGDEAFFAFLKDYSEQLNGKISTPADFFRILRTHTTADFSDILTKYFKNAY